MPATYEPIATTTLGSAAASITFSSIPATYTDISIVFVGIESGVTQISKRIYFNGDTGTNYSATKLGGQGSSAYSANNTNDGGLRFASDQNGDASGTIPVFTTFDIFSYAGSTNKTTLIATSSDQNGSGYVQRTVGLWRNTAAITEIRFGFNSAATWAAGTTATLYGIKNA
jgi:hypothetical protein